MTKPEPLISIIIPTFNRSNLLKETLDSVITQTYKNWECLLIDDGSNDDTETVAANYILKDARIKFYKRPETYKLGGNGARNYGLDLSCGDFVNWFDNDDIMLPNFLQDKITTIKPSNHFVISSHQIVDKDLNVLKSIDLKIKDYIFKDYVLWRENFCIGTPNVLFMKVFLNQNNYRFNEELKRGQEAELFSRIFFETKNEDFTLTQKVGYMYRQHNDSKTNMNEKYNTEYIRNVSAIFLMNLKFAMLLKDKELYVKVTDHLFRMLFTSKKKSRANYFFILNGMKSISNKRRFVLNSTLVLYYFMPSSSRINYFFKKLISTNILGKK